MQNKKYEIWTGIFILLALVALLFLSLRVLDMRSWGNGPTWTLYATFGNVGGLKSGAPVKVGGVVIGRVVDISLDTKTYTPKVAMAISDKYRQIPDTSSLAIRTQGLLGEQYLALGIGFDDPEMGSSILKEGDTLQDTRSAIVLEDLIGQFLYKSESEGKKGTPE